MKGKLHFDCSFLASSWITFWQRCPLLWTALFLLLGISWTIAFDAALLFPILLLLGFHLFSCFLKRHRPFFFLLLAFFGFVFGRVYTTHYALFPSPESQACYGTATLCLSSRQLYATPFNKLWKYQGQLHELYDEKEQLLARNLPLVLFQPLRSAPLSLNNTYQSTGSIQKQGWNYRFKKAKREKWIPLSSSFSPASYRQRAKQWVQKNLEAKRGKTDATAFLQGMLTGEFANRRLSCELNKVGLQHIMAISGFHFSLLSLFLSALLRRWLPFALFSVVLPILLTGYFLFIGPTPSIQRAWIMQLVFLFSFFAKRIPSAWNTLGIAFIAVLCYEPLYCLHLGFQFSFTITAAIFLFYSPVHRLLSLLWPVRKLEEAISLPLHQQHLYLFLSFIRKGLALSFSASLPTIPLSFYYFHHFPLLSLFYNLFFPLLTSVTLFLLLVSCFVPFFFGWAAHAFITLSLQTIYLLPLNFHWILYCDLLSLRHVVILLSSLFFVGIFFTPREKDDFPWI